MQGWELVQGLQLQRLVAEGPVGERGVLLREGWSEREELQLEEEQLPEEQQEQMGELLRRREVQLKLGRHSRLLLGDQELEPRSLGQSEGSMKNI